MLSNRVAAKRAYHRRVERMEGLQKENNFLEQVLAERQGRLKQLEALVCAPIFPCATGYRLAERVSPYRVVADTKARAAGHDPAAQHCREGS